MSDNENSNDKVARTIKLTAAKPAAATLASVKSDQQSVVVSVPKAVPNIKAAETAPKAAVVSDAEPIKKGPLLDDVVAKCGVKRSDAKLVLDAVLDVLGGYLVKGEDLQLPPLGKIKVVKTKEVGKGGKAITLKLRTPNP